MAFKMKGFSGFKSSPAKHEEDEFIPENDSPAKHEEDEIIPENDSPAKADWYSEGCAAYGGGTTKGKFEGMSQDELAAEGAKRREEMQNSGGESLFGAPTKQRDVMSEGRGPIKTSGLGPRAMRADDQSQQAHTVRAEQGAHKYWYKVNGKPVKKEDYIKYQNDPGGDEIGKQTNDPDVYNKGKKRHKDGGNAAAVDGKGNVIGSTDDFWQFRK
jgi:hypothetical protein